MKTMKIFTIFILVICLCQISVAEKRVTPKPIKELKDPSSPSYVPYPYPKNRNEIIEDLKYAINKVFTDKEGKYIDGKVPKIKIILMQLLENNSEYKIGEIIKVKNRYHRMSEDYSWLILIRDKKGEIAARVALLANGLFAGGGPTQAAAEYFKGKYPNSRRGPHILKTDEDVINCLSADLERIIEKNEIKKIERVAFPSINGFLHFPMFEIRMKSGQIYYYSVKTDEVYEVEESISWKKDNKGFRLAPKDIIPYQKKYVTDSINEEILVLKPLKKRDTEYQ